jgi:hypothetical protein
MHRSYVTVFFLWGCAEGEVYQSKSRTLVELEQQIRYTFASLPRDIFWSVFCRLQK